MPGVFVSYRRDDVGLIAGDVAEALSGQLTAPVFFDLASIQPGSDYQREIDSAIGNCSVVVILLGKDWAGEDVFGRRRIEADNDVLRLEIEAALRLRRVVIQVLVGIPDLKHATLPPVSRLQALQWHHIRLGQKQIDVDRLVKRADGALYEVQQQELSGRIDGRLAFDPYEAQLPFAEPSVDRAQPFDPAYFFD